MGTTTASKTAATLGSHFYGDDKNRDPLLPGFRFSEAVPCEGHQVTCRALVSLEHSGSSREDRRKSSAADPGAACLQGTHSVCASGPEQAGPWREPAFPGISSTQEFFQIHRAPWGTTGNVGVVFTFWIQSPECSPLHSGTALFSPSDPPHQSPSQAKSTAPARQASHLPGSWFVCQQADAGIQTALCERHFTISR